MYSRSTLRPFDRSTGSRLTAHGSRLTAHGSRLTAHGSRLTAHGSRLTAHGSRLTAHGSRLTAHDSARSGVPSGLFHSQGNQGFVGVVPPCLPSPSKICRRFRDWGNHGGIAPTKNETALGVPCSLFPIPYSLFPIPRSGVPCSLFPDPVFPVPF